MALFHECSPKCAQNELDIADIVRDAMLHQLTCRTIGRVIPANRMALRIKIREGEAPPTLCHAQGARFASRMS
jgi:hypothetical protein